MKNLLNSVLYFAIFFIVLFLGNLLCPEIISDNWKTTLLATLAIYILSTMFSFILLILSSCITAFVGNKLFDKWKYETSTYLMIIFIIIANILYFISIFLSLRIALKYVKGFIISENYAVILLAIILYLISITSNKKARRIVGHTNK